eukprot:239393-Pelagomonas_calceolata.AAC.4
MLTIHEYWYGITRMPREAKKVEPNCPTFMKRRWHCGLRLPQKGPQSAPGTPSHSHSYDG